VNPDQGYFAILVFFGTSTSCRKISQRSSSCIAGDWGLWALAAGCPTGWPVCSRSQKEVHNAIPFGAAIPGWGNGSRKSWSETEWKRPSTDVRKN
jgi:hypothetical protein